MAKSLTRQIQDIVSTPLHSNGPIHDLEKMAKEHPRKASEIVAALETHVNNCKGDYATQAAYAISRILEKNKNAALQGIEIMERLLATQPKPHNFYSDENVRYFVKPFGDVLNYHAKKNDAITVRALKAVTKFTGITFADQVLDAPKSCLETSDGARDCLSILRDTFDVGEHTHHGQTTHSLALDNLSTTLHKLEDAFPEIADDINAFRDYIHTDKNVIQGLVEQGSQGIDILERHIAGYGDDGHKIAVAALRTIGTKDAIDAIGRLASHSTFQENAIDTLKSIANTKSFNALVNLGTSAPATPTANAALSAILDMYQTDRTMMRRIVDGEVEKPTFSHKSVQKAVTALAGNILHPQNLAARIAVTKTRNADTIRYDIADLTGVFECAQDMKVTSGINIVDVMNAGITHARGLTQLQATLA